MRIRQIGFIGNRHQQHLVSDVNLIHQMPLRVVTVAENAEDGKILGSQVPTCQLFRLLRTAFLWITVRSSIDPRE